MVYTIMTLFTAQDLGVLKSNTVMDNLVSPINLTTCFWTGGSNQSTLKKSPHRHMENKQSRHRKDQGIKPRTFLQTRSFKDNTYGKNLLKAANTDNSIYQECV